MHVRSGDTLRRSNASPLQDNLVEESFPRPRPLFDICRGGVAIQDRRCGVLQVVQFVRVIEKRNELKEYDIEEEESA